MTKPFVRADVQAVLDMLAQQEGPKMHEVEPDMARQMMLAMGQIAERPRGDLFAVSDIRVPSGHGHDIPARVYHPSEPDGPAPALVFYHGGGWVIGDLETHDSLCAEMARQLGMTVLSVDYRLAPEHKFPAAGEDCIAATTWAANSPAELGHDVTGLVLSGDSAGGNMTAITAQALTGTLPVPILAQFLIYPGVDMTASTGSMQEFGEGYLLTAEGMQWFSNHYLGAPADVEDPRASPLKAESLAGQPRALVYTCGLDPLRDQGRAYAGRLIASGVRTIYREAPGQIHGSFNLRQAIPSAQEDLSACIADLKHLLNEAVAPE
ncbi:alpha/beta hydrolase [Pacificimonas flava]|uniref:Lipase-esterase (LipN) n=1 Tax=Pacificimonas flava TaxID=1234595 RepID=M2TBE6_9SPHN|nr:alpha/beta hydrolase [Pacificimonas flava]EMD83934.1 lipase-esterase (lipN) [Pacificimonas flava]MBB5281093.1 acetyl esterase [Pacificimonas flava]